MKNTPFQTHGITMNTATEKSRLLSETSQGKTTACRPRSEMTIAGKLVAVCLLIFFFFSQLSVRAQDSLATRAENFSKIDSVQPDYKAYDPLAPSKASFYSAVLPGLGQFYNESYWKIPLVYAALGTTLYFYIDNNKEYHRYRDAYKRRLAGYEDDEFYGQLSDDALVRAQKQFKRNKQIWLFVTIGAYIINIVDANVDAHLQQFNVDDDLSVKPNFDFDRRSGEASYGLMLNFKF